MEMKKAFIKTTAAVSVISALVLPFASCKKADKKSGKVHDSSLDVVYTKSDAVSVKLDERTYEMYSIEKDNGNGTFDLAKYTGSSSDFGRTIRIISDKEDVLSVTIDESTAFVLDKLRTDEDKDMNDYDFFISKIGKRYKGMPIYFRISFSGTHADKITFFHEYYR